MRGCVFGVGLISHDAKRAGSNIGDRANCDRQRRSFASHSSNEGFIGCPFFIRAPAPLSKLVDDISPFLALLALLPPRRRRRFSFRWQEEGYFHREIFLSRLGCSIIGGGKTSSVVDVLDKGR